MRSVDVAPLVEHRHDLVLLTGGEPVDRAPARHCVVEALTVSDAATPPLQATLGQLQAHARRPGAPPARLGTHDQLHQRRLRGRIHPARDPATAPQGPFPSASVNLTAISANAVRRRSTWAPAASAPRLAACPAGPDATAPTPRARPAGPPRAASLPSTGPHAPDRPPRSPWSPHAPAASRSRTSPAAPRTASSSHQTRYSTRLLNARPRTLPCWLKPTANSDTKSAATQLALTVLVSVSAIGPMGAHAVLSGSTCPTEVTAVRSSADPARSHVAPVEALWSLCR